MKNEPHNLPGVTGTPGGGMLRRIQGSPFRQSGPTPIHDSRERKSINSLWSGPALEAALGSGGGGSGVGGGVHVAAMWRSTTTITGSSGTTVAFSAVDFDTGSMITNTTTITIQRAGYYEVTATLVSQAVVAGEVLGAIIVTGGSVNGNIARGTAQSDGSSPTAASVTVAKNFAAGDTITVVGVVTSTAAALDGGVENRLEVKEIA